MVLEALMKLCVAKPNFFGKTFFAPEIGEKGQKRFFEFKEKFGH